MEKIWNLLWPPHFYFFTYCRLPALSLQRCIPPLGRSINKVTRGNERQLLQSGHYCIAKAVPYIQIKGRLMDNGVPLPNERLSLHFGSTDQNPLYFQMMEGGRG